MILSIGDGNPTQSPLSSPFSASLITGASSGPLVAQGYIPQSGYPPVNGAGNSGAGWQSYGNFDGGGGWSTGSDEPNVVRYEYSRQVQWWLIVGIALMSFYSFMER